MCLEISKIWIMALQLCKTNLNFTIVNAGYLPTYLANPLQWSWKVNDHKNTYVSWVNSFYAHVMQCYWPSVYYTLFLPIYHTTYDTLTLPLCGKNYQYNMAALTQTCDHNWKIAGVCNYMLIWWKHNWILFIILGSKQLLNTGLDLMKSFLQISIRMHILVLISLSVRTFINLSSHQLKLMVEF